MNDKRGMKGKSLGIVAILIVVFWGAFEWYTFVEEKSYKYADDLLSDSFSVLEVSMEDEEETYYVSDDEAIFHQLVQELDATTFKPTKQTPKNPEYIIRIYNESLEVETTISVFINQQMAVDGSFYNVEQGSLKLFEQTLFNEAYEFTFTDFDDFIPYMYNLAYEKSLFSEKSKDWAEIIALIRIAKERDIDVRDMDLLLSMAPTKEVAEQLISYEVVMPHDYSALVAAVQQGRIGVAEVLLEKNIGEVPDHFRIEGHSPVVIAKLNENQAMVDLLVRSGFKDEFVDHRHIEQAQSFVDFSKGDAESMIERLHKGYLPGVDFQIPTSSNDIIEVWGDYTVDEEYFVLHYNDHYFSRMVDVHQINEDEDYGDVFAYSYQFQLKYAPPIVDIKERLGEPDDTVMEMEGDLGHVEYIFGDYSLSFIIDSDGNVRSMSYFYNFSNEQVNRN